MNTITKYRILRRIVGPIAACRFVVRSGGVSCVVFPQCCSCWLQACWAES